MFGQGFDIRFMILYYVREVWHRRWLTIVIAWVLSLVGIFFVSSLPDRYSSQAQIYVDTESLLSDFLQGITVQADVLSQVEYMRRTLLTRPNMEQLMEMTGIDLRITTMDPEERLKQRERMLNDLLKSVSVTTSGKNLLTIRYTDKDPAMARDVTQAMLTIFREQNIGDTRTDLHTSRRFIDREIAQYEERLEEQEKRLAAFRQDNAVELANASNVVNRVQATEGQLRNLEFELQSGVWSRDQLQLQMNTIPQYIDEEEMANVALMAPNDPSLGQCGQLERNKEFSMLRYTDSHPSVRSIVNTMEMLGCFEEPEPLTEGELAEGEEAEPRGRVNPAFMDLQEAVRGANMNIAAKQQRIGLLTAQLEQLRIEAQQAPEVQLRLDQLNRDYQAIRSTYNSLIQRRESARLAQSVEDQANTVEFRIVEPPVKPVEPSGPNRLILGIGVLIMSFGVGIGISIGLLFLNNSYKTVDDLRQSIDLPIIGNVTAVVTTGRRRYLILDASLLATTATLLLTIYIAYIYVFHIKGMRPDFKAILSGF